MNEFAFKLKYGSEMYNDYMIEKNAKNAFHNLAREFFKKHYFSAKGGYIIGERLCIELSDAEVELYRNQLMKDTVQGCHKFKKNSKMQKLWEKEVVKKCNIDNIYHNNMWYWPFMLRGTYSMWDYDGTVYGCLKSEGEIKHCDDMVEMKMSEYYKVIEDRREKLNARTFI